MAESPDNIKELESSQAKTVDSQKAMREQMMDQLI